MDTTQPGLPRGKAFVFYEYSEEAWLGAYSCGNGRFIEGTPSKDLDICFTLFKTGRKLNIMIHEDRLLQWLYAFPSLLGHFYDTSFNAPINMEALLPHYPEIRTKFDQDEREGHGFDALKLFVRHFLREGSVFATFGFECLHEERRLTDVHLYDIQSQSRGIFEDLDLLDEAIDEIDERDIKASSRPLRYINEPFRSRLKAAIVRRDPSAVEAVLALDPGVIDAYSLLLAIQYYERTVFHHLLTHGAEVNRVSDIASYRAAEAGHMDMVQLLLSHGVDQEGGDLDVSAALTGAASGGHLEIVRYLVEEKGASMSCDEYHYPLTCAMKQGHTHIIDYLLRAGAHLLGDDCFALLPQLVGSKQAETGDVFERFMASMDNDALDRWLLTAVLKGHLGTVRRLVAAGANVNPDMRHCNTAETSLQCTREHSSPLAVAASKGHLETVRCLVSAGANVNPETGPQVSPCMKYPPPIARINATHLWEKYGAAVHDNIRKALTMDGPSGVNLVKIVSNNLMLSAAVNMKDDPAIATIEPQGRRNRRRTMARRLLADVARSNGKLLDASIMPDASARLKAFVDQVGTSSSVWKSGTRAIRSICEGYMPDGVSEVVSALQVADAMRSTVPPSDLVYSKREFVDDLPRWAALLSPDDRHFFFEIASCLWGTPASTTAYGRSDNSVGTLRALQDLLSHLLETYGLYDQGAGESRRSYRLQALRQQHLAVERRNHPHQKRRLTLAEWHPLPTQEVHESLHDHPPGPLKPQQEQLNILAPITFLMAGAIFGAILLYLCLRCFHISSSPVGTNTMTVSRYGFSTLQLPNLKLDAGEGRASDHILSRNYGILLMYYGYTSLVDFDSRKNSDHLVESSPLLPVSPGSTPAERVQQHMAAYQPFHRGAHIPIEKHPSVVGTNMKPYSAECSPSTPSLVSSSSPPSLTTSTHGWATTGTPTGGTIYCEHCNSRFQLGKNGRRGQASNFRKHMKIHHPETIPNYRRVIHECRHGCGARDPNKSNIKVHERKHCANRKGKQPRRHGKWRRTTTETC
ncbi:hypothetical protein V8C44DRAFT_333253 [Trichoderma aethiopicum]